MLVMRRGKKLVLCVAQRLAIIIPVHLPALPSQEPEEELNKLLLTKVSGK